LFLNSDRRKRNLHGCSGIDSCLYLIVFLLCPPVSLIGQSALLSPTPGSTFNSSSATFIWTAAPGAVDYEFFLGSTGPGSYDVFYSGTRTGTSLTVDSLPVDGKTIYARLFTRVNEKLNYIDYTFTAATLASAQLTAPAIGSALLGTTATFTWTAAPGATSYQLFLGSNGPGSYNVYDSGSQAVTSLAVDRLPTGGQPIYARLYTHFSGTSVFRDYVFTATSLTPATLTAPAPGSTLITNNATFTWTAVAGATNYELFLGTTGPGSHNVFYSGDKTVTTLTVPEIPLNGEKIYARLYTRFSSLLLYEDYSFSAPTVLPSVITSPPPGRTLPGASATFTWTPVAGASYALLLGTAGIGSSDLWNSGTQTVTSVRFDSMPTNGESIYARLITNLNGTLEYSDYTFTAKNLPAAELSSLSCRSASITAPGTDPCMIMLNAPAPAGGQNVKLSSSTTALILPSAVTVPANTTSMEFSAQASSVISTKEATITASSGSVSKIFTLQLTVAEPALTISATTLAFGDAVVNSALTQEVTMTSTGSSPLTISAVSLTGAGFTLTEVKYPLTLNPEQAAALEVHFDPDASGPVTGQLTITSNATPSGKVVIGLSGTGLVSNSFAYTGSPLEDSFVPPGPLAPISNEFFGMTILNLASNGPGDSSGLTPFPDFSVATLRLWDVAHWAMLEPSGGRFDWTKMDGTITTAQQHGVSDFIFTFGRVPDWASTSPSDPCTNGEGPGSCTAPDMDAFDDFATHVIQRYCGSVKYYETWNEPNSSAFWHGTNTQLLTIAQHLYRIAKDPANCGCSNGICSPNGGANPNRVLLPPISDLGGIAWLDSYMATAGADYPYADVSTFHGYGFTYPEDMPGWIQALKQTLATHGLSNLELWNTEASWEWDTNLDVQQQVSWLMRYHLVQNVLGESRLVWYAYDSCTWGTLWASKCSESQDQGPIGQLTNAGEAYSTINKWLIGASLSHCVQYENGLWTCELKRPGNYDGWVLWNRAGKEISVPVPPNLGLTIYRDWQDNLNPLSTDITVGPIPVLLENRDY
jgi:hypothetical protein